MFAPRASVILAHLPGQDLRADRPLRAPAHSSRRRRLWDHLIDCPFHHFQYDVRTGENHFPRNVYPEDIPRLQAQLRPLEAFPVKMEDGWIWVDLDPATR
jgi:nitrite reductase/ring-hydroxylating ferredoxin subunit